jgi:hypothetical protein
MTPIGKFQVRSLEPRTLSWWRNRQGQIDMEPPYQRRGRLWSTADKAFLIDSILNEFDIPKFYVADFTWGDSELNRARLPYAIIDGKQRFEAIFDFYRGDLLLQDDFVYYRNSRYNIGGLGYKDLQRNFADVAEVFDNFAPHVMGVYADNEEPINSLFVRLNRSKPLTGAEIRNAMGGPVPEVIRELGTHEFFTDIVAFSVKRAQDLNAAGKILLFEYHHGPRETKKKTLDAFVREVNDGQRERLELAARQTVDVLNDMRDVFLPKDRLVGSAGIIPVYYWVVRQLEREELARFRSFLVEFEKARYANRKELRENPGSKHVDQQLVEYDNYNRSTNDQMSHEGRVRILVERFRSGQ